MSIGYQDDPTAAVDDIHHLYRPAVEGGVDGLEEAARGLEVWDLEAYCLQCSACCQASLSLRQLGTAPLEW